MATKFEKFLEIQGKKEQEIWKSCLPHILEYITEVIKYHPCRAFTNWLEKSLPNLRTCYAKARRTATTDYKTSIATVKEMCNELNGWSNGTGISLKFLTEPDEKYYGKAAIAKSFDVVFIKDGAKYEVKNALDLIKSKNTKEVELPQKYVYVSYKGSAIEVLGFKLSESKINNMRQEIEAKNDLDRAYFDATLIIFTNLHKSQLKQYVPDFHLDKNLSTVIGVPVYAGLWKD